jgi:hypothetical protein
MLNNIWVNVHAAENSPQMRHRDVPFVGRCLAQLKRQRGLKLMLREQPKDGVGRKAGAAFTALSLKAVWRAIHGSTNFPPGSLHRRAESGCVNFADLRNVAESQRSLN